MHLCIFQLTFGLLAQTSDPLATILLRIVGGHLMRSALQSSIQKPVSNKYKILIIIQITQK